MRYFKLLILLVSLSLLTLACGTSGGSNNQPPVAIDDNRNTSESKSVAVNVIANDSDIDGSINVSSLSIITHPANGTAVVDTNGTVLYTPDSGYSGTDTFTYTIDDNSGATSNVATVTISISLFNQPPVAADDTVNTLEATTVSINVIANDSDIDGSIDISSLTIINLPANGTAVVDTTGGATIMDISGLIQYTPYPGYSGTDTFTYTIDDDSATTSNEATVTISISPSNQSPVAADDTGNTMEDTMVSINVIANDSDADGTIDLSTLTIINVPSNGTAVAYTDGTIRYTPNSGYSGIDSFTYTIDDDRGVTSNEAKVTITISISNQPPVTADDTGNTLENTLVSINVIANDTDNDGIIDLSTLTIISVPSNGTAVSNTDGSIRYTPDSGYLGIDTFTYTIDDDSGATSNEATVTVTITLPNQPPVAVDDNMYTNEATPVTIKVINNDSDADGTLDLSTLTIINVPANGTAEADTDGSIRYTPNSEYSDIDTFTYIIDDNSGATSNEATVTIYITFSYHQFEAETARSLESPFEIIPDSLALNEAYITVPQGSGDNFISGEGAEAEYTVNISQEGEYQLWGRVIAPGSADNSFFVEIDDNGAIPWWVEVGSSWSWNQVSDHDTGEDPAIFYLTKGIHTIKIRQREDGTKLDKLILTNDLNYIPDSFEPYVTVIEPQSLYLQTYLDLSVMAIADNIQIGWGVRFILDINTVNEESITIISPPFETVFQNLSLSEHTLNVFIVDETEQDVSGEITNDHKFQIGIGDYYVGVGDSITKGVGDNLPSDDISADNRNSGGGYEPILNNLLTQAQGYPHTVFNEGSGGDTSADGKAIIGTILNNHPDAQYFLVLYGANDAGSAIPSGEGLDPGDEGYNDSFKDNMQQIITAIINDGKEVYLAYALYIINKPNTIPRIQAYNRVVDTLVNDNGISVIPPDFYTYFEDHQDEYTDQEHPDGTGYNSMATLWYESLIP